MQTRRILPALSILACAGLIGVTAATQAIGQERPVATQATHTPASPTHAPKTASKALTPFTLECDEDGDAGATQRKEANPEARLAAQKGLDFLARETAKWQEQHNCYGCHVQAVTLEAFAVGRHHQYEISEKDYSTVLHGLTTISGGASDGSMGLRYAHGDSLRAPSKAFGGAALGRHDQWVSQSSRDELLKTAAQLESFQQADGEITLNWTNPPVGAGAVQGAYQAIQTWNQAYARTAEPRWRAAARKSEAFLQKTIDGWHARPPHNLQDVNYAILGLLAAGVGSKESSIMMLQQLLLRSQHEDGGWDFRTHSTQPGTSNAFATGQALYTLRMLGMSEADKAVARGTAWLMEHQQARGGWSMAGFGKAEAMWGVLGLVSLDKLSLEVTGLGQGIHVEAEQMLGVEAWDNSGAKVTKTELVVDDIPVHAVCSDNMLHTWDTTGLEDGAHVVDVRAYNSRGDASTRRFMVYVGDVFLTNLGARFDAGGTMISWRNIAPKDLPNRVRVSIHTSKEVDGKAVAGEPIAKTTQQGTQGAMAFTWDGKSASGEAQKTGEKYVARLSFVDREGQVRQTEEVVFVHDTYANQRAQYSEVTGQIQFGEDEMAGMANAEVELLDEEGNVVQSTRSTSSGNYRFKGVERDKDYKVRVKRRGFETQEKKLDRLNAPEAEAGFAY